MIWSVVEGREALCLFQSSSDLSSVSVDMLKVIKYSVDYGRMRGREKVLNRGVSPLKEDFSPCGLAITYQDLEGWSWRGSSTL
jgi:hypothetical protein